MGANSRGLGADHARAPRPRHARGRRSSGRSSTAWSSAIDARARRGSTAPSRRSAGSPRDWPVAVASSAHRGGHRRGARRDRAGATSSRSSSRPTRSPTASRHPTSTSRRPGGSASRPARASSSRIRCNGVRAGEGGRDDRRARARTQRPAGRRDARELADLVLDRLADLDPRAIVPPRLRRAPADGRWPARRPRCPARRQPRAADDPLLGLADSSRP